MMQCLKKILFFEKRNLSILGIEEVSALKNSKKISLEDSGEKSSKKVVFEEEPENVFFYAMKVHENSKREVLETMKFLTKTKNKKLITTTTICNGLKSSIAEKEMKRKGYDEILGEAILIDLESAKKSKESMELINGKIDFSIAVGGDGTILSYNRIFAEKGITAPPVIGFKPPTSVGFSLSYDIKTEEMVPALDSIIRSEGTVVCRSRLQYDIFDKHGKRKADGVALNDVFLNRKKEIPILFDVLVDDEWFVSFKGDGCCISTATGSTGLNLSCGGVPLCPSNLSCLTLTPINLAIPFGFRPFVVSDKTTLTLRMSPNNRSEAFLSQDALEGHSETLVPGDTLQTRIHPSPLLTFTQKNFTKQWLQKMRQKYAFAHNIDK